MFFQFQNKQQRIFSLLSAAVVIVIVMTLWSYAWAQYFDLGANEPKEALEVAGFGLLVQFFLCLPYLYFKRYMPASLWATSILNGAYLFLYWSNSTPLCCGDMGQGLMSMLFMFVSGVYFVVSCLVIIACLHAKKVRKIGQPS